ncbi:MAG: hypothetical protein KVP17_000124 [Porospora cf. gigantea B]|uniref:uncharacterized protein n=1 Tax=Porospora cf. gigantea B TaxID=2853592 RepID=UPI003571EF64|nr:MAG: hypothetical protein KVP17_000124 [Porospora cf. gigantea B]
MVQHQLIERHLGTNTLRGRKDYHVATLEGNWFEERCNPLYQIQEQAELHRQQRVHKAALAAGREQPPGIYQYTERDRAIDAQKRFEDSGRTDFKALRTDAHISPIPEHDVHSPLPCGHRPPSVWETVYNVSYDRANHWRDKPWLCDSGGSIFQPEAFDPAEMYQTTNMISYRASQINPFDPDRRDPERVFIPDQLDQFRPAFHKAKSIRPTYTEETTTCPPQYVPRKECDADGFYPEDLLPDDIDAVHADGDHRQAVLYACRHPKPPKPLPEDDEFKIEECETEAIETLRVVDTVHPESELRSRGKRFLVPQNQETVAQALPIQRGYQGCRYHSQVKL